jgi:hypothetical protein
MPRKLESWVEISESVSRLCTFDAGNGGGGGSGGISVILLLFLLSPLAFLRFYLGPGCSIFIPNYAQHKTRMIARNIVFS